MPVQPIFKPEIPTRGGDRRRWGRFYGSSAGLTIAGAAQRHHGPVLVITPDTPAAQRLDEELDFYLGGQSPLPRYHFPDWETLPYDPFSPHQDIISQRLTVLSRLPELDRGLLVVPASTLMVRMPPVEFVSANSLSLDVGQKLAIDELRRGLERSGYRCVGQVMEHGEFAVRGALFDLFPMGSPCPYRIDLFDDEIDTIRSFDPESQRTLEKVEQVRLLPAREFPLDADAIQRFREAWREHFEGAPSECPIYRDVSAGLAPAGIEYYLPLFFAHTCTLFDYLPDNCLAILLEGVDTAVTDFQQEAAERYEESRHDRLRPLLPPNQLFLQENSLFEALKKFPRILCGHGTDQKGTVEFGLTSPPKLPVDARAPEPLQHLKQYLENHAGRVLLVAETPGRRETLLETLGAHQVRPNPVQGWPEFLAGTERLAITVAALEAGLELRDPRLSIITEGQLFGQRAMQRRRRRSAGRDAESVVRDLTELSIGAPVVHEDKGVGRYLGLQTLTVGKLTNEFLALEYAGGDKLYVPVSSLQLISRYTGADADNAPMHRLGSNQWQKARKKAAEKIRDVAAELLEIHARRAARRGHAFDLDSLQYQAFLQSFPFEETADQAQAIDQVLADMRSDQPMDRLVCGDVGFGKTEVAMRAAFVAVQDGSQVALLVPTTLLAQQHHQTFQDRFADWPVRVEQLSRFGGRKKQEDTLQALTSGHVDIVIGTHKLLQDDVRFKRLGLVIIDEEHRFGVRHKERFKSLRAEVDVLTLTATPIPRTLNMAMSGMRDLSIIATPPARRLSVKTFVSQWNGHLIREACLRELKRGGQVFFLHNKVETIDKAARELEELVPEAQINIAHGQMRERELEQAMLDFYHRRFNILVCTTIIETGIDVPNANTIVINRADHFGLAQLHQLRGRVGRSHHRAYAYLMVPPRKNMTPDAVKRLEAIESLEDLGIGFTLATHDLEIRGAGELLGSGQSGQIHEIGYSLYSELLERAVKALKQGRSPQLDRPLEHGTEIDLHVPALIPEDYLPDVHSRLILYKRIANADSTDALRELQVEMIDRFGLLPDPLKTLFAQTEMKLLATPLGVRKIDLGATGGRLEFQPEPDIDPARLIQLIQAQPLSYRLDGADKLRIHMDLPDAASRLEMLREVLTTLCVRDAA